MKIIICILTRNEPRILEQNLRHHIVREGVAGFVIMSHITFDVTNEVLAKFPGYILSVREYKQSDMWHQGAWATAAARTAMTFNPDWVIVSDTDEFWYGLKSLENVPGNIKSIVCTNARQHYGCREDFNLPFTVNNLPWYRITQPSKDVKWQYGKVILRFNKNIRIKGANHTTHITPSLNNFPGIVLHHYPVREWNRFLLKVNTGNCLPAGQPRRRNKWRNMQMCGNLYDHYLNDLCKSQESLKQAVLGGTAGYFKPELLPDEDEYGQGPPIIKISKPVT